MPTMKIIFKTKPVILLVPLLCLLWGLYAYFTSPAFFLTAIDPEYPYLINGLNVAMLKFGRIGHTDHPGTAFQLFNGIVIKLTHIIAGRGNIAKDVLSRPEFYLGAISLTLNFVQSVLVLIIGIVGVSRIKLQHVFVLHLTPFFQSVLIDLTKRVNPDRFFIVVSLLFVIAILKYAVGDKRNDLKFSIWSGITMGLGLATKLNYLPILFLPLFIIKGWKKRIVYGGIVLVSFTTFISPILQKFPAFREFTLRLIKHDGLYGSGESRVFNISKLVGNIEQIFTINPELFILLGGIVFILFFHIIKKNSSRQLLQVGFILVFIFQIVIVAKHFKNYYFAPFFTLYGYILYTISADSEEIRLKWLKRIMQLGIPLLILIIAVFSTVENQFFKSHHHVAKLEAVYSYVECNITDDDFWLVEPTWVAAPYVENGLVYGLSYCTHREKYEPLLTEIYPNTITYSPGDKVIRNWKCSLAEIDTVLVSGKEIYIYDTPRRNAKILMRFLEENAIDLGLDISFDTVFSQPSTKTQIIQFSVTSDKDKIATMRKALHSEIKSGPSDAYHRKVDRYIQEIKLNKEWLESVRKKANERGISLDSMLYLDAVYMVNQE